MTVFRIRSIYFESLVGFTKNFAQMSSMMIRLVQGKKLTLFCNVAHGVFITFPDSSSLRFHLPLQKN